MVLGPPRSGKTTSLIIPNVLAAHRRRRLHIDQARRRGGYRRRTCGYRDAASSSIPPLRSAGRTGLPEVRWSPLQSCTTWLGSLSAAQSLVATGGPGGAAGDRRPEHSHWTERAEALLAPLLHAAAVEGGDMRTVLTWVDRRLALPAQQILSGQPGRATELARNLLDGIVATDERELSGIWSTASGALGGFRSHEALRATADPTFDPVRLRPLVRHRLHRRPRPSAVSGGADGGRAHRGHPTSRLRRRVTHGPGAGPTGPVLLALDELANIAPLPDLPAMVSEGGGQGVTTLACFQDLTQARRRWPVHADGFPSLFGTTVVLPGIGDVRTLDALSQLAGDEEVPTRTVSAGRSLGDHPVVDLVTGGRPHVSESLSTQWRRRLPVDVLAHGAPGHAVAFDERNRPSWVPLAPSHHTEPWRTLRGPGHEIGRTMDADPRARDRAYPTGRPWHRTLIGAAPAGPRRPAAWSRPADERSTSELGATPLPKEGTSCPELPSPGFGPSDRSRSHRASTGSDGQHYRSGVPIRGLPNSIEPPVEGVWGETRRSGAHGSKTGRRSTVPCELGRWASDSDNRPAGHRGSKERDDSTDPADPADPADPSVPAVGAPATGGAALDPGGRRPTRSTAEGAPAGQAARHLGHEVTPGERSVRAGQSASRRASRSGSGPCRRRARVRRNRPSATIGSIDGWHGAPKADHLGELARREPERRAPVLATRP